MSPGAAEAEPAGGGGAAGAGRVDARPLTLAEALAGVGGPARGAAEGALEAVVLLGQLLNGLLQVDALLPLILQGALPFPAVGLR